MDRSHPQKATASPDGDAVLYPAETVLSIAIEMGVALLRCGADVHRVEDTMTRICTAYGAVCSDVFVITSLITAEVAMPDGSTAARVRRVGGVYNHLGRLEEINSLSRAICAAPRPLCEVKDKLDSIRHLRPIPEWLCYVGGMLATGSFALFFGGSLADGMCAAVISLFLTLSERSKRIHFNPMARSFIRSFAAGLLAVLCVYIGIGSRVDAIIIGTIMLEIPGISMGNAMRDMLCGDTISGVLRLIQALLHALLLALGYMAALALCGAIGGGVIV